MKVTCAFLLTETMGFEFRIEHFSIKKTTNDNVQIIDQIKVQG